VRTLLGLYVLNAYAIHACVAKSFPQRYLQYLTFVILYSLLYVFLRDDVCPFYLTYALLCSVFYIFLVYVLQCI